MINLIYFILTAYGLTQILVYGKLFDSIRPARGKLKKLFECPMCMGFWVGANLFILGWLSSGTSYILNMVFGDNGVKHEYKYLDK